MPSNPNVNPKNGVPYKKKRVKILYLSFLIIISHLLKKSLMANFIFCAVSNNYEVVPEEFLQTEAATESVLEKKKFLKIFQILQERYLCWVVSF